MAGPLQRAATAAPRIGGNGAPAGRSGPALPVRPAVRGVVQPFVMRRQSPKGWVYCSSFDQSTVFDNEEEARAHDAKLIATADVSLTFQQLEKDGRRIVKPKRFFTPYTYTHIRTTSELHDKQQGPHSFPFCQVDEGFKPLKDRAELLQVFYEQVPPPDEVEKLLLEEKNEKLGDIAHHIGRLNYDYASLYNDILALLADENSNVELLRYYIRRILEMHPYAAYKWKTQTQASKRALRGKGERKDQADADTGGVWRNKKRAGDYLELRGKLHKGDYQIAEEELQYDGPLDGEYATMEELIEALIVGQEKVGNTIHLFPTGEWIIAGVEFVTEGKERVVVSARVRLQRRGG